MTSYASLTAALIGHFDQALSDLPNELRARVALAFQLVTWDHLSPAIRQDQALQWDFNTDPECDARREAMFAQYVLIKETEDANAPTVLDLQARDQRIREFEQIILREEELLYSEAFARWHLPPALRAALETLPSLAPDGRVQPIRERARSAISAIYPDGVPPQIEESNADVCKKVAAYLKQNSKRDVSDDTILRAAGRRS